jgi:hypothetical protein
MKGPTAAQTKKLPPGLVAYMKKHGQPGGKGKGKKKDKKMK